MAGFHAVRWTPLLVSAAGLLGFAWGAFGQGVRDASLDAGRPMAPAEVRWRPVLTVSPLPPWAPSGFETSPSSALFAIPARWQQPEIDRFVLTVVFYDTEDAGPVVVWRSATGVETRLSDGLGESGEKLGLHARTLVLPDAITRDGGFVIVSMPMRQDGLVSATVQPARDVTLAVAGASLQPGLVSRDGSVIESEMLEGRDVPPVGGDVREGPIIEAELSAAVEPLEGELEFAVPVSGRVEGAVLFTEIIGLDPANRVDVEVNGRRIGELNPAAFRLDDPAVTIDPRRRLTVAGWRKHSLFLPGPAWLAGSDNSIVLRVRGSTGSEPILLKNSFLHMRFASGEEANADPLAAPQRGIVPPVPDEPWPTVAIEAPTPDFGIPIGVVDEPPPTPTVTTTPPQEPYKFPPLNLGGL